MGKISKRIGFILFPAVFMMCLYRIAESQGIGTINVRHPLLPLYMDTKNISLEFCKKNPFVDPKRNIHNGIDISVPANEPVFSLCDGRVAYDNTHITSTTYWNSFLIIEHNCNGYILFAYYGHVYSSVNNANDIEAGEQIAIIRHDTSGNIKDHLHLSITVGNDWDRYGWGYDSTCEDAIADGYKNPLTYLNFPPSPPENLRIIEY